MSATERLASCAICGEHKMCDLTTLSLTGTLSGATMDSVGRDTIIDSTGQPHDTIVVVLLCERCTWGPSRRICRNTLPGQ